MKNISIPIFLILLGSCSYAQVSWKFSSKKISDKTFEIHMTAAVDEQWHLYAQNSPKGGPLPTKITFSKNPLLILQGKIKEKGEMDMYHDETFDVDVYAYTKTVDFVQVVKLKSNVKTIISGTVEYMACTKEQCLTPQKLKYTIKLD